MNYYLKRTVEEDILKLLSFFPAVAIVGPRQVGKTSLTTAIRNQASKSSLYLDLERTRDLEKIDDLERYAEDHLDYLIILDEVQHSKKLFPELRSVIDRNRTAGRFLLLGSASPDLIRDTSESLAGRISFVELTGLSLREVETVTDYRTHWFRGGFPDSLLAPTHELSHRWRENFIRSYVERELPKLGLEVSPVVLERLWRMLAYLTGQNLNVKNLSNSMGLDVRTVNRYLDFFEQAYLIRRLPPYFTNIGKRLVKSPKMYLRDTGLVHFLVDIDNPTALFGHPIIGASWETYVIEQLFAIAPRNLQLYYYRTQAGAELDLIIVKGITPVASVEIKNSVSPTLSKGFYTANEDLKIEKRFVVAPVERSYAMKGNIRVVGPSSFEEIFE